MRAVFPYIRTQLGRLCFGLTVKLVGTVVELLLPWMLSVILDEFVPAEDGKNILLWGGLMLFCALLCLGANVLANGMATGTSRAITEKLRGDLFRKVTALTCAEADRFTVPSLISRLTSDTYNVHQMIDRMQRIGVRAPILLIGGIAVTLALEPVLALVLLATFPILGAVVFTVTRRGVSLYGDTQKKQDGLVRRAQESMTGIRVIRALSKESYENERFDAANEDVVRSERRAGLLMNVTNPVMNLVLNFGLTAVIVVGAYRVNGGQAEPGTLIAFLSYFTIMLNALMMISRIFMLCSKGSASATRLAEVLEAKAAMDLFALPTEETDKHIEFRGVSFSYDKVRDNVTDVTFSLRRGETLGIIGPTGSGKSTVLNLLLRFYDADRGEIRINGRDVRAIPKAELYRMFGVALQNDFLFGGTIGDNVDFERGLDASAIRAATELAQAEFIATRKDGLDGNIAMKGADLSGGQKQRLLLARALAAEPDILLLDDASSALDYKTDALLRKAMGKVLRQTTKIIVAQRVSSIRHADQILVLDDGKVLGLGTHEELLNTCASYRDIAEIQMGEV